MHICNIKEVTSALIPPKHQLPSRSIRVALTVDQGSLKDFLVVMNSVLNSAENPSKVVFHIVAVGRDIPAATELSKTIRSAIESCIPLARYSNDLRYQLTESSSVYLDLSAFRCVGIILYRSWYRWIRVLHYNVTEQRPHHTGTPPWVLTWFDSSYLLYSQRRDGCSMWITILL